MHGDETLVVVEGFQIDLQFAVDFGFAILGIVLADVAAVVDVEAVGLVLVFS